MPAVRGARPIRNKEVLDFHENLINSNLHIPTLVEYADVWKEWINFSDTKSLIGLGMFDNVDYTQGTSQTFDQFILKHCKDREILVLKGDFQYHACLGKHVEFKYVDYPHHLESVIRKACKFTPKIIISETLFSMDGDKVDVSGLRFLAKRYHAILYLDEAHAAGVYGKQGFGLSSSGKKYEREVVVGTFGKSFGSYGAFVSSSEEISQKIINTCGGLIYSTALPPSILGSIYQAVKLMPKLDYLRKKLLKNSEYLLNELKKNSFNTGRSNSQIIPIIMRCPKKCLKLTNFLRKSGFFTKLIKPPTVPVGSERIRLSLTATMDREIIKKFVSLISSVNLHEI